MLKPRVSFASFVIALGLSAALPRAAEAGPVLLGITGDSAPGTPSNQLIQINTTTGVGTLIGSLDSQMGAFDLAVSAGKLFTYDQDADLLRQLDPLTGHTVNSVNLGLGDLIGEGGLAFNSSGQGVLAATVPGSSTLDSITTSAGSGALIGTENTSGIDGLAFNAAGNLFALGQLNGNLYSVNQASGALSLIGTGNPANLNVSLAVGGLTFLPGSNASLFAAINDILYSIDPVTGLATQIGTGIGFSNVSGLAFVDGSPVPEPATLLLFGTGIALLARRGRRRA